MINGQHDIDVSEWRRHTHYNVYQSTSKVCHAGVNDRDIPLFDLENSCERFFPVLFLYAYSKLCGSGTSSRAWTRPNERSSCSL
jgi:hypothetical protein